MESTAKPIARYQLSSRLLGHFNQRIDAAEHGRANAEDVLIFIRSVFLSVGVTLPEDFAYDLQGDWINIYNYPSPSPLPEEGRREEAQPFLWTDCEGDEYRQILAAYDPLRQSHKKPMETAYRAILSRLKRERDEARAALSRAVEEREEARRGRNELLEHATKVVAYYRNPPRGNDFSARWTVGTSAEYIEKMAAPALSPNTSNK